MGRPWIKLYTEMLHDPKVGQLSDGAYRLFIELMLKAGQVDDDGATATVPALAWELRRQVLDLAQMLDELDAADLIFLDDETAVVHITSWSKRQPASTSAERVKRYRDKKKKEVKQHSNGDVTLPERYSNALEEDLDPEKELEGEKIPPSPPKKRQPAPGRKKGRLTNPALDLPADLVCLKDTWRLFQKHRMEKNRPVMETEATELFRSFREWGPERSEAALLYTIRKSWQGVEQDPSYGRVPAGTNGSSPPTPQLSEAQAALAEARRRRETAGATI